MLISDCLPIYAPPKKDQEYTYALWVTNPNVVSLQRTYASQPPLDTRQGMLKARKICRCSVNGYNLLKTLQLNVAACGSFILANTEGLHPTSHWSSFRSSHHGSPWISMDLHGSPWIYTWFPGYTSSPDEMLQWRKEAAEVGPMDRILAVRHIWQSVKTLYPVVHIKIAGFMDRSSHQKWY